MIIHYPYTPYGSKFCHTGVLLFFDNQTPIREQTSVISKIRPQYKDEGKTPDMMFHHFS